MKRILIGGFLLLSGTIGIAILLAVSLLNPVSAWVTPPGRLICTVFENGITIPLICFLILFLIGLVVLVVEFIFSGKSKHEKGN